MKEKVKMRLLQVLILLLLLGPLCNGQQMTHEEQVVRTTYAKLSFADEVRIVLDAIHQAHSNPTATERELNSHLDFQLSNFKVGNIREIAGQITADIAGIPEDGNVLEVVPSTFNYKEVNNANEFVLYAKTRWTKARGRFVGDG